MARWVIHSSTGFGASHALTSYNGEPETSHHHDWRIAIRVGAARLNAEGFAIDFHEVHRALAEVVGPLDGSDLNQHPEIGRPTPSAERIAEVVAERLRAPMQRVGGSLLSVSVWEGPENRVDLLLED